MATTSKTSLNLLFLYEARGEQPTEVTLSDCSISFFDEKRVSELVTGVYGTKSKQSLLESVSKWNVQHGLTPDQRAKGVKQPARMLILDAQYAVDSLEAQRQRASADSVATSGWLNLDRLTPTMRDELHEQWLMFIRRSAGAPRAKAQAQTPLLKLVEEYPQFVPNLFKTNDKLLGVLHPIRPKFDPSVSLWAATVRLLPKRFVDVRARYYDVKVKVS